MFSGSFTTPVIVLSLFTIAFIIGMAFFLIGWVRKQAQIDAENAD